MGKDNQFFIPFLAIARGAGAASDHHAAQTVAIPAEIIVTDAQHTEHPGPCPAPGRGCFANLKRMHTAASRVDRDDMPATGPWRHWNLAVGTFCFNSTSHAHGSRLGSCAVHSSNSNNKM